MSFNNQRGRVYIPTSNVRIYQSRASGKQTRTVALIIKIRTLK